MSLAPLKRCVNCGREDSKGFSKIETRVSRNGERSTEYEWVCRPGFGCEGIGDLHLVFLNDPEPTTAPESFEEEQV